MNYIRLFNDYRIEFSTKKNRGWVNIDCPYCDTHRNAFNLGINPDGDYCTCWKCGYHKIDDVLKRILNVSSLEIKRIRTDYEGNTFTDTFIQRNERVTNLEFPFSTFTDNERKYLKGRGFDPDYIHFKYGVCGGGLLGKWSFRIIVPLIHQNRIVSWTGRSILSKENIARLEIPRYKNLSESESIISPKNILYNLDHCNGDTVVLTEGAFDVMKLGDSFCCSFGITVTERQIQYLNEHYRKVFIMFDNEVEAQNKARKYGLMLSSLGTEVEIVDAYSEYGKKDGGELDELEVNEIRNELELN